MKSLKLHFESLLDDDDVFFDPANDKKYIEEWIRNNYNIVGKLTISDDLVVNCDRYVYVENKNITALTNGMFKWGNLDGSFDCSDCTKLKSLEGAPEKIDGGFSCRRCNNLTSLKGAPKKVKRGFSCGNCNNLTSLKGAPEKVGDNFRCNGCDKLTSLKGAPEKVGGNFYCQHCDNLTSLEGAPKEVGGNFYCFGCKNLKITDSDHKKYRIMN